MMKKIISYTATLFATWLLITTPSFADTETYTLDPTHSYVLWHINHFGFSNPSGKWMAAGTLSLDEKNPKNSKVNVTINIADIQTGVAKLDEHLKDKDFFDVAQFPTATFISDTVTPTGKSSAKVHGILTVHGISKPVILDVILNKLGQSPITNKKTAGFTASTEIKRTDFGIDKYTPGLGDEVKINIEAEATLNP
jgi:polyisoprenoid-binding protein YceI